MKTTITLLLTILFFGYTQAQAPSIQWQKCLGGLGDDVANSIQLTSDGGYIVAGWSYSTEGNINGNHGGADYWVVKLDSTGTIQWQKSLGGSNDDCATSIQTTSDGGYVVAGYSSSINGDVTGNHGIKDYWVVKLDALGNIQWQKSLGGNNYDAAESIQTTFDGGYVVVGYTDSNNSNVTGNHGGRDCWVVKLDATGTIQWQKTLGGTGIDYGNAIQNTSDGGYVVAGYTFSNDGEVSGNHGSSSDYWIIKLDALGIIQWQKCLGGSGNDYAKSIKTTSDEGYIVVGRSNSNDGNVSGNHANTEDYWVVKLNALGVLQWQKSFGGYGIDVANTVQTTSDGGYIVAGYSQYISGNVTVNHGGYDFWVIKLDAIGIIQWQKSLGGSGDDYPNNIQLTSDGGYIVVGESNSIDGDVTSNHGGSDFWVVKLGTALTTTVFKNDVIVIYPNPVCDVLQIQTPANTSITSAKIIAVNGQVVLEHTQNSNTINVENLAQGVYILEAYSGEDKYTSKFVKE